MRRKILSLLVSTSFLWARKRETQQEKDAVLRVLGPYNAQPSANSARASDALTAFLFFFLPLLSSFLPLLSPSWHIKNHKQNYSY